jgi:hypothetical protein
VADAANPLRNADGSIAFTPVPANTSDPSPVGYIVAAHSPVDGTGSSAPKIMVWHWAMVSGAPTLVSDGDVAVSTFDIPAPVPQPGTSNTLDSLDARLTQAVAVNDPGAGGAKGIWTQHTVAGPGGRSVVRWYEILAGSPATLRQHGEIGSPTDFVFNGAVSPSIGGGSAAVFYNRGGSSTLPVIGAQTRGPSTALGSLDPGELVLGQSSAADLDFTCGYSKPTDPCRWGDYAGASPDPLNDGVVWGSNQTTGPCYILCGFFAQWQTRNFAVVASAPATPVLTTISVAPTSASVQTGGTQQFNATGRDQFGNPLSPQPTFSWSVSGGGTISSTGLFSATTPGGPFTVTAASGSVVSNPASVTVTDFSLSANPTTRSIKHGQSTTYAVTITRNFGFTGSVALTVTGLPSNVTASFSPTATAGTSSTLTIATSGRSVRGTYSLTIVGTSGGLTRSVTVSLTLR